MLKVLGHHLICYITAAPRPVAYRPEVLTPVPPSQLRKLFLQPARRSPFQPFYYVADCFRRRVLYEHMHVVLADYPLEYADVFGVAYLHDQVTASLLDLCLQHWVAVLCHPYQVYGQARDGVAGVAVVAHAYFLPQPRILRKMCSN